MLFQIVMKTVESSHIPSSIELYAGNVMENAQTQRSLN